MNRTWLAIGGALLLVCLLAAMAAPAFKQARANARADSCTRESGERRRSTTAGAGRKSVAKAAGAASMRRLYVYTVSLARPLVNNRRVEARSLN